MWAVPMQGPQLLRDTRSPRLVHSPSHVLAVPAHHLLQCAATATTSGLLGKAETQRPAPRQGLSWQKPSFAWSGKQIFPTIPVCRVEPYQTPCPVFITERPENNPAPA